MIFKEYLELGSLHRVKKHLDNEGYKTNQNKNFNVQSRKEILSNDF